MVLWLCLNVKDAWSESTHDIVLHQESRENMTLQVVFLNPHSLWFEVGKYIMRWPAEKFFELVMVAVITHRN